MPLRLEESTRRNRGVICHGERTQLGILPLFIFCCLALLLLALSRKEKLQPQQKKASFSSHLVSSYIHLYKENGYPFY